MDNDNERVAQALGYGKKAEETQPETKVEVKEEKKNGNDASLKNLSNGK